MTELLLATTFLIDAERSSDRLDQLIGDDDDVAIAAITVAELRVGVELSAGSNRARRAQFVDGMIDAIPVIDYDLNIAAVHAKLLTEVRRRCSGWSRRRGRGLVELSITVTVEAMAGLVLTGRGRHRRRAAEAGEGCFAVAAARWDQAM